MLDNGLREEIMKNLVDDMVKEYEEEYIIIEKYSTKAKKNYLGMR